MSEVTKGIGWRGLTAVLLIALGFLTLADQTWAAGSFVPLDQKMDKGRYEPMVVTLLDGRILVAGGVTYENNGERSYSSEVDVFDPKDLKLTRAGSLQVERARTEPILLSDGKVLFVGGGSASSEIYDPATGTSEMLSSGSTPLDAIAALPDGKVLLASPSRDLRSASVLDIATRQVTPVSDPPVLLNYPSRPLTLPDGRILIFGGVNSRRFEVNRGVLFDPANDSFTEVPGPLIPRDSPTLTVLDDGKVLISGGARDAPDGNDYRFLRSAEIYDPATGNSSRSSPPISSRASGESVKLSDGRILTTGGDGPVNLGSKRFRDGSLSSEIYDPETGRSTSTGDLSRERFRSGLIALPNGSALIAGGLSVFGQDGIRTAETFDPQGQIARVKRIVITPKVRSVKIGKRYKFRVRMTNSGEGTARFIRVCITSHDRRAGSPLSCARVQAIPPGQSRQTVVRGRLVRKSAGESTHLSKSGSTKRYEIYAVGQDVNVYSTARIRIR